jgi:hypothetical protein
MKPATRPAIPSQQMAEYQTALRALEAKRDRLRDALALAENAQQRQRIFDALDEVAARIAALPAVKSPGTRDGSRKY